MVSEKELIVKSRILGRVTVSTGPFREIDEIDRLSDSQELREVLTTSVEQFATWLDAIRKDMPVTTLYESIPHAVFESLYTESKSSDDADGQIFNKWYRAFSETPCETDQGRMVSEAILKKQDVLEFTVACCNAFAGRRGLLFSKDGVHRIRSKPHPTG